MHKSRTDSQENRTYCIYIFIFIQVWFSTVHTENIKQKGDNNVKNQTMNSTVVRFTFSWQYVLMCGRRATFHSAYIVLSVECVAANFQGMFQCVHAGQQQRP